MAATQVTCTSILFLLKGSFIHIWHAQHTLLVCSRPPQQYRVRKPPNKVFRGQS